jgi:hypothetical protein
VERHVSIDVQDAVAREQFAEQLHTTFTISAGGLSLPAELVEFTERPPARGYEQFSLLFRVPRDAPVVQATWDVEHPALGTQALFLVPVDRDEKGMYVEAVFNRHIRPAGEEA